MIVNSAFNEGLAGLQQSQKRLQQVAHELSKAGLPTAPNQPPATALGGVPATNFGVSASDLPATSTIGASAASYTVGQHDSDKSTDLVSQQMQQQLLFDASAKVLEVAKDTLGNMIDDLS